MKSILYQISLSLLATTLYAQEARVDVLLEKVQKATTIKEKNSLLAKLKVELAKINKKARDESNAIIEAKKKLPSKIFDEKNLQK